MAHQPLAEIILFKSTTLNYNAYLFNPTQELEQCRNKNSSPRQGKAAGWKNHYGLNILISISPLSSDE